MHQPPQHQTHQPMDGETLLFIHGWGVHSGVWLKQIEAFADDYNIVVVDLPGHGTTPPVKEPLTIALCVERLVKLVDQLKLKDVHLVGWSLGTQIACLAAPSLGERVRSVTLVAGTPRFVAASEDETWGMSDTRAKWFRHQLKEDFRTALEQLITGFFRQDPKSQGPGQGMARDVKGLFFNELFPPDVKSGLELLDDFFVSDIRDRVGDVRVPCLICHGDRDTIVPVEVTNIWQSLIPSAQKIIFEQCGHAPFLERTAVFNDALRKFISSVIR